MLKGQLERALRKGYEGEAGSGQQGGRSLLPKPPDGARTPIGSSKTPPTKGPTKAKGPKSRAAGKRAAAESGPRASATAAFANAFQDYGETLRRRATSKTLVAPSTKSSFGDFVSRLIRRRVEGTGASREQVVTAVAAANVVVPKPANPPGPGTSAVVQGVLPVGTILDPRFVLLVNRVTGAFLESEYVLARGLGVNGYLQHHVNLTEADDLELNAFFAAVPDILVNGDAPMSPTLPDLWDHVMNGTALQLFIDEDLALPGPPPPNGVGLIDFLQGLTVGRAILSRRRLLERMTEFWTDHFNISIFAPLQGLLKPVDDREVVRDHALGSFHDMLYESAHSAAMMAYLDQFSSQGPNPNENYARELLELHTVGEGQGYNEDDVRDVAALLTGWSIGVDLAFDYNSLLHIEGPVGGYSILKDDPNPIQVDQDLLTSPTEGQQEGEDLISGLQTHPNTASYIAQKMLRYMLRYDPTPQQVTDVARVYTTQSGSCQKMLEEILQLPNLNSLLATNPSTLKVKRPFQLATTFLRQVGGEPEWSTTQVGLIESGGSGYDFGDQFELQGGTLEPGGSQALFEVTDIDIATGEVKATKLLALGDYVTYPTNPAATTTLTGVGSGCTMKLYEAPVNPFGGLIDRLKVLANAPFEWGPPNGYPDAEQAWIGNLLGRWELLGDLVRNEVPGIVVDQDALLNLIAAVPGNQVGEYLNMVMAGGMLTSEEEDLVQAYFNAIVALATQPAGGPPYLPQSEWGLAIAELFALVGTAPSYQYY